MSDGHDADPTDPVEVHIPVPKRIVAGIQRARDQIARPGTWWTAAQRVAIAATARAARAGGPVPANRVLPAAAVDVAAAVAVRAHTITADTVDQADTGGVRAEAFVEIVGVVARTAAIDTTARGIGAEPVAFPDPTPGAPTNRTQPDARRRSAFVPMVGGAGATTALSAVDAECAAQEDLHGALYLTYAEMDDLAIVKGLPRWQLELVAARTSLINQCFF